MNLIDRLSIISPADAERLRDISFDSEEHKLRMTRIQDEVGNISAIKRDIAYKTGWIFKKTRSKDVKQYVDMILVHLNRIEECLNKIRITSNNERASITGYSYKLYSALHEDNQCQT